MIHTIEVLSRHWTMEYISFGPHNQLARSVQQDRPEHVQDLCWAVPLADIRKDHNICVLPPIQGSVHLPHEEGKTPAHL